MGVGAQAAFIASIMGHPPAIVRKVERFAAEPERQIVFGEIQECRELIFLDHDYWLQIVADESSSVVAYSVSARTKRFRPVFSMPSGASVWAVRRGRIDDALAAKFGDRVQGRLGWYRPLVRARLNRTRLDRAAIEYEYIRMRVMMGARFWTSGCAPGMFFGRGLCGVGYRAVLGDFAVRVHGVAR